MRGPWGQRGKKVLEGDVGHVEVGDLDTEREWIG